MYFLGYCWAFCDKPRRVFSDKYTEVLWAGQLLLAFKKKSKVNLGWTQPNTVFTLILGFFSKGVVTCSHNLWRLLLPHLFQRFPHNPLFWRNCFDSKTTFNWPFIFQCRMCLWYIARQAACWEMQFLSQDSVLEVVDVHLCLIFAKNTHSASVSEFLDWCGEGGESLFYIVLYLQTKWWFWNTWKHIWERR